MINIIKIEQKDKQNPDMLIQGDCLESMDMLISKNIKFDAIITDPPYGITDCKWDIIIPFDDMWQRLKQLRYATTPIILFGSEPFSSHLRISNIKEFKYDWIWNKKINGAFATVKFRPGIITENISVFGRNKINYFPIMVRAEEKNIRPKNKGSSKSEACSVSGGIAKSKKDYDNKKRFPINIIEYSKYNKECNQRTRVHPTQKPVALIEYLINTYTKENDIILDFTMGSGTTGVACINLNRRFIGIEKDEKYFNIAKERIQKRIKEKNREMF